MDELKALAAAIRKRERTAKRLERALHDIADVLEEDEGCNGPDRDPDSEHNQIAKILRRAWR